MNRIVREHYPVSKLPEDLRLELSGIESARVTIEADTSGRRSPRPLLEILDEARRLRESGQIETISSEEAVARIRELRDEWD